MRRTLALLAAACALALAGCTDHSKDEKQIRALVTQFAAESGPRACDLLTTVALGQVYGAAHPVRLLRHLPVLLLAVVESVELDLRPRPVVSGRVVVVREVEMQRHGLPAVLVRRDVQESRGLALEPVVVGERLRQLRVLGAA